MVSDIHRIVRQGHTDNSQLCELVKSSQIIDFGNLVVLKIQMRQVCIVQKIRDLCQHVVVQVQHRQILADCQVVALQQFITQTIMTV